MKHSFLKFTLFSAVLLGTTGAAWAQEAGAGEPLPTCTVDENAYYVFEWEGSSDGNLRKIALGDYSSAPTTTSIWDGKSPATVAAGMGLDGYAYGIADHGTNVSIIKYGTAGAEVLGQVVYGDSSLGTVGDDITDQYDTTTGGDNYNAADIHPGTGHLFAGALIKGGSYDAGGPAYMDVLLEIDITASPPELVGVLDISPAIPQTTGDFAISADGQFAYAGTYGTATWWKIDLSDGSLTSSVLPGGAAGSYGAAALLPNGDIAFDNKGTVDIFNENGDMLESGLSYNSTGSQDGARCLVTADDPTAPTAIPTLGQWAMIFLATLLAGFGVVRLRRRH